MDKVLLVEDEEMIMKSMEFMVDWNSLGCFVCATASDGREGIEKILSDEPDIVITDIRIPFVDGLEMLQETHDLVYYETIILSGYSDFSYAQKAISLGVSQYLLKPVDFDELKTAVEAARARLAENRRLRFLEQHANKETPFFCTPAEGELSTRAKAMLSYIYESYDKKISLQDLSESLSLSVPTLHNKFKESTGYTFNDFLNRHRIQQAVNLMRQTNMKIYEVAQSVGITDYKYFNQVFKKYTGTSPSAFLKGRK